MEKTIVDLDKEPEVEKPIFIEGLAGIGHIGRNTVSYIADQTDAEQIGEIKSHHFPPHTVINDDATVKTIKNKIYQLQRDNADDLILLEGNAQASTPEGHHEVAQKVMQLANDLDSKKILTIGGYGTGEVVEKPDVFGATTTEEVKEDHEDLEIVFDNDVGQIVGISGLLIGRAKENEVDGICLLGETPGFLLSDSKSTEKVLQTMEKILDLDLDYSELEDKVEESQDVLKKLQNLKKKQKPDDGQNQDGDLGYIG